MLYPEVSGAGLQNPGFGGWRLAYLLSVSRMVTELSPHSVTSYRPFCVIRMCGTNLIINDTIQLSNYIAKIRAWLAALPTASLVCFCRLGGHAVLSAQQMLVLFLQSYYISMKQSHLWHLH